MLILTENNTPYDLNILPDGNTNLRYGVIDYTNTHDVDYQFIPLMFLETFNSSVADIQLGKFHVMVPIDWSIIIGDKHSGELEPICLKQINDRDFEAFSINPINGYMPSFLPITINNIFADVSCSVPRLRYGHILVVPLSNSENPECAFFVKDVHKLPDNLDIGQLV